ncbi:TRAP transporter small permease [Amorphus orientalis]|uniref:TRAP transporter small permease protein n=1 Tax=Amorphus orientalis TaxID=649198 RepID=A0AAE3VKM2_9HYPH|nr:TRAP transporter small permease [Amorphus orientalis]MDQ0313747.1 TRAP-type C4-dicarboxylate transport system permease small subunit [Amorphus orientalis]
MKRFTLYLALAGTAAFLVAVVLTVIDILLRSVSTLTVHGLTDIVTLCTMIGAMLAIPYGFASDQQVSIDVFTSRMSPRLQAGLRVFAALLGLIFLAGVTWFASGQMLTEYGYGDRSQSIGIPMVWYWIPLLTGIGLAAIVNVALAVREIRSLIRG